MLKFIVLTYFASKFLWLTDTQNELPLVHPYWSLQSITIDYDWVKVLGLKRLPSVQRDNIWLSVFSRCCARSEWRSDETSCKRNVMYNWNVIWLLQFHDKLIDTHITLLSTCNESITPRISSSGYCKVRGVLGTSNYCDFSEFGCQFYNDLIWKGQKFWKRAHFLLET